MRPKNNKYFFVFCVLLLLATTMRGFIPVGFMPGQVDNGKIEIVICSGFGEQTIYVNADQLPPGVPAPENQHDRQKDDTLCAFAPMAAQAVPGFNPVVQALDLEQRYNPHLTHDLSKIILLKSWFSQGPPALTQI